MNQILAVTLLEWTASDTMAMSIKPVEFINIDAHVSLKQSGLYESSTQPLLKLKEFSTGLVKPKKVYK